VAKIDGDAPNHEELTPTEETVADASAVPAAAETAEVEAAEEQPKAAVEKAEEEAAEVEPAPNLLPDYLALAGAVVVPLILLALAWLGYAAFSTAIYFIGLVWIPYGLWLGRKKINVYTVFLGCVAAVLLTAVYFLWTELARYNFDIGAKEAKQRVGAVVKPPARIVLRHTARLLQPDLSASCLHRGLKISRDLKCFTRRFRATGRMLRA